jgi:prepilin-type N-terminal cleavage/methylation domain-containing protein
VNARRLHSSRSPRGFTLLELLLATAVAAIVLLVINTAFFSALRLHNTTHAKIDSDLALQRALGIIRRDLAGLMLPTTSNNTVLAGPLQTGVATPGNNEPTGDRITPDLYTNAGRIDGWGPFADAQIVAYYLSPATDGSNTKTLVRAITRNILSTQESGPDEQQQLLPGVSTAEILFYDGTDWVSDWDSTTTSTMPTAIKFRLAMARAGNEGATVPESGGFMELLVPVLVTTTTSQQAAADAAANP